MEGELPQPAAPEVHLAPPETGHVRSTASSGHSCNTAATGRLGSSPWAHPEDATLKAPKALGATTGNFCQKTSVGITQHLRTWI